MTEFIGFGGAPMQIPKVPLETRAEQKPQPWVNVEYEKATESVIKEMQAAIKSGKSVGSYLGQILEFGTSHPIFKRRFDTVFSPESLDKIRFQVSESVSASEVADQKIQRGIFIVDDELLYAKLYDVFVRAVVLRMAYISQAPHLVVCRAGVIREF